MNRSKLLVVGKLLLAVGTLWKSTTAIAAAATATATVTNAFQHSQFTRMRQRYHVIDGNCWSHQIFCNRRIHTNDDGLVPDVSQISIHNQLTTASRTTCTPTCITKKSTEFIAMTTAIQRCKSVHNDFWHHKVRILMVSTMFLVTILFANSISIEAATAASSGGRVGGGSFSRSSSSSSSHSRPSYSRASHGSSSYSRPSSHASTSYSIPSSHASPSYSRPSSYASPSSHSSPSPSSTSSPNPSSSRSSSSSPSLSSPSYYSRPSSKRSSYSTPSFSSSSYLAPSYSIPDTSLTRYSSTTRAVVVPQTNFNEESSIINKDVLVDSSRSEYTPEQKRIARFLFVAYTSIIVGCMINSFGYSVYSIYAVNEEHKQHNKYGPKADGATITSITVSLDVPNKDDPKSILYRLKQISTTANTVTNRGLQDLVTAVTIELTRQQSYINSVSVTGQYYRTTTQAERKFRILSFKEQSKVDRLTVNKFRGENKPDKRSTITEANDTKVPTKGVVTLTVAMAGNFLGPKTQYAKVKNREELINLLTQIGSDVQLEDNRMIAAEIFWSPEEPNDILTQDELYFKYPELLPL